MTTKLDKVNERAKKYGYGKIYYSTRNDKKFMTRYRGKLVHFGATGYEDFLDHGDEARRQNYRKRHRGIRTRDNKEAYRVKGSSSNLSFYILW
tara:strand:- start:6363 stop:6641 length:279 start_codon:yes stop_codon:yes gene_type:complete